ncbi:AraD1 family protein [Maribacter sp. LLG6340-A2]|uniref:AraD1 family protein n=1 Tax=Maribacter sp. LLG6340-A2 TaxID=3160834 RepID=UPI00386988D6
MNNKIRLVQLCHPNLGRRVALVTEPQLLLLNEFRSVYELALRAIETRMNISAMVNSLISDEKIDYDSVYECENEWKLLPSFDYPDSPFGCMVSGTGLTHKNSALNRQMMHQSEGNKPTDSIQMYEWGVKGGFPKEGEIGIQPEWFYKGNGTVLKAHGQSLDIPSYADDGGEEPELAGIYIVDRQGVPWRIGLSTANEFSDHVMEKKNYLYLAPSKLRECAIGPEIIIDADFEEYKGKVSVIRNGKLLWGSDIKSGEKNMSHSLANLEYHHFKYASHRIPLQAHVHFFGADAFSFGNQIELQNGDTMEVEWNGLGRSLKNTLNKVLDDEKIIAIKMIQ